MLFGFASIHLRPIAEYVMLTEGRSARDLLRKKNRTLAARSKKQKKTYKKESSRPWDIVIFGNKRLHQGQWRIHSVHPRTGEPWAVQECRINQVPQADPHLST